MKPSLDERQDRMTCSVEDGVAVLKLGAGVFDIGLDLEAKDRFRALLDEIEASPSVKTVLLLNAPGALSEAEYTEFLNRILGAQNGRDRATGKTEQDLLFCREENAIQQFVLRIHRCEKMVVTGLRGAIATPGLGAALATDFRFASENTVFMLSHAGHRVPPDGALGFFLPRYVGQGKAVELILSGGTLTAGKALELGLVNAVFSEEKFEVECMTRARAFARIPPANASLTKALLYSSRDKELEQYLEREFNIMRRAWARRDG